MTPHRAAGLVAALCLLLVLVAYLIGLETGRAATLAPHPGYEAAARAANV